MRRTLIRELIDIAADDERVLLLTADLGFTVVETFSERFPERFFNVGVAEQNMLGVATGLAEAGYLPFVYSIAPFAVLRPFEFIRNGPVAHRLPVRIIGIGGGVEYGTAGFTHYGLEDLGLMRLQPGMTVIAPADHRQAAAALQATWNVPGPVYYRIGKDEEQEVRGLDGRFRLDGVETIVEGEDMVLLAAGPVAASALAAADRLRDEGIRCTVAVVACLAPAPERDLVDLLSRHRVAVSVETHYDIGGLGSMIAELIARDGIPCRLVARGFKGLPERAGAQARMEAAQGLDAESLIDVVKRSWRVAVHGDPR